MSKSDSNNSSNGGVGAGFVIFVIFILIIAIIGLVLGAVAVGYIVKFSDLMGGFTKALEPFSKDGQQKLTDSFRQLRALLDTTAINADKTLTVLAATPSNGMLTAAATPSSKYTFTPTGILAVNSQGTQMACCQAQ